MIDLAKIRVKAGDGGNGAVSFLQLPGMRHGKPDGGDGGKGGNVYLKSTRSLNTLESFRYQKNYFAGNGGHGGHNHKTGKMGKDLIIDIPVGTQIKVKENSTFKILADVINENQLVLVAKGGRGGRGNSHFKKTGNFKYAEKGELGEFRELILELKLIADVGIIGLPNSGKSTLLSVLTSAKPKIADYPFTTLEPNLGVLNVSKFINENGFIVLADIPGLIEGASEGKGLGDEFLRHIERTKILVHLIDVSTQTDKLEDYKVVRNELQVYGGGLDKKKEMIVLSKIDSSSYDNLKRIEELFSKQGLKVLKISAVTGYGLNNLVKRLVKAIRK